MGRLRPEPLVLIKSNLTKSKGHNSAGVQLIEPSKAEVIRTVSTKILMHTEITVAFRKILSVTAGVL